MDLRGFPFVVSIGDSALATAHRSRLSAQTNGRHRAASYQKLFFCPYQTLAFFHCGLLPPHPMLHLNHWL